MGGVRRTQPARGRTQPDRYTHVNGPKKKLPLSRAAQRRCSAQTAPPSVFLLSVRACTAELAHTGTVALPPCRATPLDGSATTLGT